MNVSGAIRVHAGAAKVGQEAAAIPVLIKTASKEKQHKLKNSADRATHQKMKFL